VTERLVDIPGFNHKFAKYFLVGVNASKKTQFSGPHESIHTNDICHSSLIYSVASKEPTIMYDLRSAYGFCSDVRILDFNDLTTFILVCDYSTFYGIDSTAIETMNGLINQSINHLFACVKTNCSTMCVLSC